MTESWSANMRWDLNIFSLMFFFLPPIENINLKLDGLIDFGPKWNFEYSVMPDYETTRPPASLQQLRLLSRTSTYKTPTLSSEVEPTSTVKVETNPPTSEQAKTASETEDTWPITTEESTPARYTEYIFEDTHKKKKRVRFTLMPADNETDVTIRKEQGNEDNRPTATLLQILLSKYYSEQQLRLLSRTSTYKIPATLSSKTTTTRPPAALQQLRLLSRTSTYKIPTLSSEVEPTSTVKVETNPPTSEQAKTASEIEDTSPITTEESTPARYTQYIFEDTHKKKKRVRFTLMPAEEPGNENIETDNPIITEAIDISDPHKYDNEVERTAMKPIHRQQIQLITQPSTSPKNISTMPPTLAVLRETTKNYKWMTNNSEIYNELHKVQDDDRIKEFTLHVMRQNLQVFENIKNKIDDEKTKKKLNLLSKNYIRKFADFVHETRHQNVKTRLGTQKVILNTIGTSKNILERLVNYFIGNIKQHPSLRNLGIENVIQTEVDKEIDLEYKHACKKFGICRTTTDGFQKFFIDIITDLLKNNNTQLRIATDSLAEAIKNTDFGKVVDWDLQKKVDNYVWEMETMETDLIKPMYTMWRNAIAFRNEPITVMRNIEGGLVNKTVAFIDLMDILDSKIQANEPNKKLWQNIKSDLSQWTLDPKTMDIQKVVVEIVKHIEFEIDQLDVDTAQNINDKLTIMLSSERQPPEASTVGLDD